MQTPELAHGVLKNIIRKEDVAWVSSKNSFLLSKFIMALEDGSACLFVLLAMISLMLNPTIKDNLTVAAWEQLRLRLLVWVTDWAATLTGKAE